MPSPQSRRILFAIRSKLGDTLISYACVRAYADAHPDHQVTLLTRTAYARLLCAEPGLRVIGFDSRIGMFFKLMWLRVSEPPFDVLAVLWGSGAPIRRMGQWVRAHRKIAWSKRFAPHLFEEPQLPASPLLVEPAAFTVRVFDRAFVTPQTLHIPSLARRYAAAGQHADGHAHMHAHKHADKRVIGIVPVADELRRNLDSASLLALITQVQQRHPGDPLHIFVNPANDGVESLVHQRFPDGVHVQRFTRLDQLLEHFMQLKAWYGTDTGLYHLAAAIGIPATVFFGPTQPHKIVMPQQTNAQWWRLQVLGDTHCDEKRCRTPVCLYQAVVSHGGVAGTPDQTTAGAGGAIGAIGDGTGARMGAPAWLDAAPPTCPLRAHPPAHLARLRGAPPRNAPSRNAPPPNTDLPGTRA